MKGLYILGRIKIKPLLNETTDRHKESPCGVKVQWRGTEQNSWRNREILSRNLLQKFVNHHSVTNISCKLLFQRILWINVELRGKSAASMNNNGRAYIVLQALHDFNAIMTQVKLSQVHKILESLQLRDAVTLLGRNRCFNVNGEGKYGLKKALSNRERTWILRTVRLCNPSRFCSWVILFVPRNKLSKELRESRFSIT